MYICTNEHLCTAAGGGYDPKLRAPAHSSAPVQSACAPMQSLSAPAAVPMASVPASKWQPCALPSLTFCRLCLRSSALVLPHNLLSIVLCFSRFLSCVRTHTLSFSLLLSLCLCIFVSRIRTTHVLTCTVVDPLSIFNPYICSHTFGTDGGGYDPKRRGAPAQSLPAQSYAAPAQSYSAPAPPAPAAAPMASASASKWEPCTLLHFSLSPFLSLALPVCICLSLSLPFARSPCIDVRAFSPALVHVGPPLLFLCSLSLCSLVRALAVLEFTCTCIQHQTYPLAHTHRLGGTCVYSHMCTLAHTL